MLRVNWNGLRYYFLTFLAGWQTIAGLAATDASIDAPTVISVSGAGSVKARWQGREAALQKGDSLGRWVLMAVVQPGSNGPLAVFEDFSQTNGHLLFADEHGVKADLPKSSEPTWADPKTLYHGHRLEEVFDSERDLLGEAILAKPHDPEYADVAACVAPISKMYTYSFVGTRDCLEKVGVFYGGVTPNFDPAAYVPEIRKVRDAGRVLDGLVGGWLPALRFVYPEKAGDWSELIIYAPMRVENGNPRVQPVWYRLSRVEGNALRWVSYFDSYHPFPPRMEPRPEAFYEELLAMRAGWERALAPGMQIDIPDQRLANLARHSLVREMMTRVGAFPKYGVFDRSYGGSEHDGFPDTFNVDTAAMLAWGLFDLARQYIDNYFTYFVRDDGSILYRGPETGQYGRMLTVVAQYANYTGDHQLLLRHRRRLDAVAKLLLSLRAKALRLPTGDPGLRHDRRLERGGRLSRPGPAALRAAVSLEQHRSGPRIRGVGGRLGENWRQAATGTGALGRGTPTGIARFDGGSSDSDRAFDADQHAAALPAGDRGREGAVSYRGRARPAGSAIPFLPRLDGDALLGQPDARAGRDDRQLPRRAPRHHPGYPNRLWATTPTSGAGS